MKLFSIPFYKGTFLDTQGSTITKAGTIAMSNYGKGHSLTCNGSSTYVYSGTVTGDYKTIVMEFWLSEKVDLNSTGNNIGSLSSTSFMTLGIFSGVMTNETFTMYDTIGGIKSLYIKDNIPAGYNQIILVWNGSVYDCWLNGTQATTYIGREQSSLALINGGDVYIGKREGSATYFTGGVLNWELHDNSFTTLELADKFQEFDNRVLTLPAKKDMGEWKDVYNGDGTSNYVDITNADSTIGAEESGEIEFYTDTNDITGTTYPFSYVATSTNYVLVRFQAGKIRVYYRTGATTRYIETTSAVLAGGVKKITIGSDATNWYVKIDDVTQAISVGAGSNSGEWFGDVSPVYITLGAYRWGATDFSGWCTYSVWDLKIKDGAGTELVHYPLDESSGTNAYELLVGETGTYGGDSPHGKVLVQDTYIKEDFTGNPADGQNKLPIDWTAGTGVYKTEEISGQDTSDIVTNGDFDDQTAWTKEAGWSVANGVASQSGSAGYSADLSQVAGIVPGAMYRVSFEITAWTQGTIQIIPGYDAASSNAAEGSSLGKYSEVVVAGSNSLIYIHGKTTSVFIGSIDNVVVERVFLNPNGTKYLQCTTAGTIGFQNDEAYGTWEFDIYKGADANNLGVGFILDSIKERASSENGYWVGFNSTELIFLQEYTSGNPTNLFLTATSYIAINTWYRIKVTRTTTGVFTVYIKGGAFGNDYVQVVEASGDNPVTDNTHTTNNYCTLDIDVGDRVANITHKRGIE